MKYSAARSSSASGCRRAATERGVRQSGDCGASQGERPLRRSGWPVRRFVSHQRGRQIRERGHDIYSDKGEFGAVLVVRRSVKRSEIAATITEVLPEIFLYAQQNGIALAGLPFTRYRDVGPGSATIEPGVRVAVGNTAPSGAGEVRVDTLPGGPAATTLHCGRFLGSFGSLCCDLAVDESRGYRERRSAVGILCQRSVRVSGSQGLEDGSILAARWLAVTPRVEARIGAGPSPDRECAKRKNPFPGRVSLGRGGEHGSKGGEAG